MISCLLQKAKKSQKGYLSEKKNFLQDEQIIFCKRRPL